MPQSDADRRVAIWQNQFVVTNQSYANLERKFLINLFLGSGYGLAGTINTDKLSIADLRKLMGMPLDGQYSETQLAFSSLLASGASDVTKQIALIGASRVEGWPVSNFANTIGQLLAAKLATKYNMRAPSRGFIGVPSAVMAAVGSWPTVLNAPIASDDFTFNLGHKHRIAYTNGAGSLTHTFDPANKPVSTVVKHIGTTSGAANCLRATPDGAAAQLFSTVGPARSSDIGSFIGDMTAKTNVIIDNGNPGVGYMLYSGIDEINTAEGTFGTGIKVHNFGNSGYSAQNWLSNPGAGQLSSLELVSDFVCDLYVYSDFPINDMGTTQLRSTAQAVADLQAVIDKIRGLAGGNHLVLLPEDCSHAVTLTDTWANIRAAFKAQFDTDAAKTNKIYFVDMGKYVPNSRQNPSLFQADGIHTASNGAFNEVFASALASKIL